MADGSVKAIEDVENGDWVWAEDPATGEKGARQVTDLIVGSGEKDLVRIVIDGHVITATDEHPFWVVSREAWVDAEDLVAGDIVLTAAGETLTIDDVASYTLDVSAVHNLTVADLHTYYVLAGESSVLVHNCSVSDNLDAVVGFRESDVVNTVEIDLLTSPSTWPKPAKGSVTQVYTLVDIDSEKLLKVGRANDFSVRLQGRGNRLRAIQEGKNVRAYVLEFKSGVDDLTIEKNMRALLRRRGHRLDWDNSHMQGFRSGSANPSIFREAP